MTLYHFDPIEDGFAVCTADGEIRTKFVAIGEIIGLGPFRNHGDLVRKLLMGPLGHFPQDFSAATEFVRISGIPVAFGNIYQTGEILILVDSVHEVNFCREHEQTIRSTLIQLATTADLDSRGQSMFQETWR